MEIDLEKEIERVKELIDNGFDYEWENRSIIFLRLKECAEYIDASGHKEFFLHGQAVNDQIANLLIAFYTWSIGHYEGMKRNE